MSTIPIRRGVQDLFYRYKMERIQTKVEGKGNGIKTVVVNLTSVAESLARPEDYIMKYFQLEVGATAKHDKDDRWKINGSHDAAKLQELLYDFIDKFVLCKKCQNPETDVSIKKDSILLDCKACGQRTQVDLRLKLSGYILKGQSKKGKSDKADRKAARKAKQNGTAKDGSGSGDDDDDDDDNNDSGDNANENGEGKEGEDAELAALQAEAARLNVSEPAEVTWASDKTGVSKSVQLGEWIEEQGDAQGSIDKVESDSIRSKVEELEIGNETETPTVLAQAIFDENIVAQIPKRAELLKQLLGDDEDLQMALLGGTERQFKVLRKKNKELLKIVGRVLQLYYEHDIVSEEVLIEWADDGPSRKYADLKTSEAVHKGAEKFLELLKEADEEDSDEESD